MNGLQMKAKTAQELANMDLANHIQNAHIPNKKKAAIITGIGLFLAVMPWIIASVITLEPGSEALEIVTWVSVGVMAIGLYFAGVGLVAPLLAKKQRKALLKDLERIEKHHGGLEKAVDEIKAQLAQGGSPAYTINSGQHIAKDWFFGVGRRVPTRIINLSDVICIIGIMGAGTFIILADGEEISVMFSPKHWGESFDLFCAANPYILHNDDEVTMTNGKATNAETAYRKKDFAAITQAYSRKKNSLEAENNL
ncbi:MAG: hypothetical protein LBC86_06015 [Oscillospiraceae bacterium]|jgi:hypothetical protein|nr:hypothetical protein [Oscillospiraceae bacterium]